MKIVIFDYNHNLGISNDEILYLDGDQVHAENLEDMANKIKLFKPDLMIEREYNDGKAFFSSLYDLLPEVPKAWWCIDLHTNMINHIAYAKQFDFVFCAQSWFIPLLANQVRAQLYYLPLCHTQSLPDFEKMLAEPQPERDIKVSFVGNIRSIHVDRAEYVKELMQQLGDEFVPRNQDYHTTLKTLRRSKATFNCSLNDDLNFRVWEALACDAALVTDYVPDIMSVANLARHIHRIYPRKTETRLTEVVDNPHISTSQWIKSNHTLTHRYEQLLWMIGTGSQYEYV